MRNLLLLFLVLLVPAAAFADPLPLTDDLTGTITVYYDEQDPSAGRYEYSYRFPRIDPDNAAAYLVNNFYESEVRYVDVYDAPTMADYYADLGEDYTVRITYEITLRCDLNRAEARKLMLQLSMESREFRILEAISVPRGEKGTKL